MKDREAFNGLEPFLCGLKVGKKDSMPEKAEMTEAHHHQLCGKRNLK